MVTTDAGSATDLDAYLRDQRAKSLLRFITCGSVDDGKSTLIGRLLYDARQLLDDQVSVLEAESRRIGTQGSDLDFALLVDGLSAEREQGITIDVAYRFFATDKRKFIVADTPGHEQYTRNMVTGASTADVAVILIDARKGVLTQTRRHSYLVQLLGIRHVVLAVNKMDLVDFRQAVFDDIVTEYRAFGAQLGIGHIDALPVSGLRGDNVVSVSGRMPWYAGPSLLGLLENLPLPDGGGRDHPFRLPVQWINRPNLDFRGVAGQVTSGAVRVGDEVRILPSGRMARVARLVTMDGDLQEVIAGQSVTVCFSDEVDCSRGDVLAAPKAAPEVADQFEATVVWMVSDDMVPGRRYWLKLATQTVAASLSPPKYQININTLEHLAAKTLALNAIGVCTLSTDRPLVFEPYAQDRTLGGFILVDRENNGTVAAGMLNFSLRRAQNIHHQLLDISRESRARLKNQRPAVLWFTGLSGAGKSTIANLVEKRLHRMNRHTFLLDGDNVRHGLNKDLGFTEADRVENLRRAGEVAKLMTDAGLIVITAFISPFRAERQLVRDMISAGEFFEIFIDTPLAVAESRDVKGLYKKARAGHLKNFTGIDSPYEPPMNPEIRIETHTMTPEQAADLIVARLIPA